MTGGCILARQKRRRERSNNKLLNGELCCIMQWNDGLMRVQDIDRVRVLVGIDKSSGCCCTCLLGLGFQSTGGGKSDDAYALLQICSMSTTTFIGIC